MARIYDALIDQLSRQTQEVPSGWMGLVQDDDDQDVSEPALPQGETTTAPYLGGELRSTMNKALAVAVRQERVVLENEPGKTGLILSTARSKGKPRVNVRRRGPRTFEEIPPGELRAVAKHLCESDKMTRGSDEHLRAVLECFDLRRLTTQVGTALLDTIDHPTDHE
jgi:hypothetical protein